MSIQKVHIVETFYDEKRDLVQWLVKDTQQKQIVLCWLGKDLGPAVGINAHIPPHLIAEFCSNMEGKEVNLDMRADITQLDPEEFKKMSQSDLEQAHDTLDQYPFYEVLDTLEEQGKFHDSLKDKKPEQGRKPYATLKDFIKSEN